jgi:SAM-dependent methyltransferase
MMDTDDRQRPAATGHADHGGPLARSAERRVGRVDYDAELQLLNEALRGAYDIRPDHLVVDIGCGTGQTTRDAARLAVDGSALGVDLSASMIDRARELARAEGVDNVAFECADVQVHRFPKERFDVAISRFGTMFFREPVAAFTNIARALRPAGRLVMMVWQEHEKNEWSVAIERSIRGREATLPQPSETRNPFSLADRRTVSTLLGATGFTMVRFTDVHDPIYYGPDAAAALDWACGFASTREALESLDPADTERALERLRNTLSAHVGERGVWFDARAWIVEARRG